MELRNAIIEVVKECAGIILTAHDIEQGIEEKEGAANFVTKYDKMVQDELFAKLKKVLPEAHFVGEEEEVHDSVEAGYAFIVDPIDGTTNFIKDYKMSAISVGLLKDGMPYIGVVYNPYLREMFSAEAGLGAWLNDKPIHVSDKPLSEGIVLFGTSPYNRELADKTFAYIRKIYDVALDVRRSGSAALDLCSIAAGRAEAYFEMILSPWDYAAGALIVKEAGGYVTALTGDELVYDKKCSVLAGGSRAYKEVPKI
ncbi:MAG: inositol monophosphatase [Lachnospiraceae bacterium]|nr:inositol monophosphatase [Lachnospiraceae bacterium]